ncbi:hypothetical protein [Rhodopila globiformis]|uniref:Uncharacterized protein n=1 Tax=Rhodopila globiformis TaxID=1071 RepID=A0A2S6N7J3_RHOGL|nr:hypothetical protein [Rhodopila globiformis]PPQ30580.1 hypothetical protein CCS01_18890 [Rhodopila globiformis]
MTSSSLPPGLPTLRPADTVTDPTLFARARARWPGHRVTAAMLADVARLEGRPLYVPATPEAVAAGLDEVRRENSRAAAAAGVQQDYARMGFDPAADYHTKRD